MRLPALLMILVFGLSVGLSAQELGSITGIVRDTAGAPVAGAEVMLGNQRAATTPEGTFRFDSLRAGNYLITIRLAGYAALRTPIVVRAGIRQYNFVLRPAAYVLPTVYTEARRAGIDGTVGDTSFTPLAGVKVQLAGRGGGEAVTDSSGRFGFPGATEGQYLVRAVHPGYAEERLFLEVTKGEGVDLGIRLRPSSEFASRADEVAVEELGRRLVANLSTDRLNASHLNRYGSLPLCEVSRIAARVKRPADSLTIIVNGTTMLEKRSVRDLCAWRAAEVELVEFGDDVCRDVTRTLVDLLNVWCYNFRGERRDFGNVRPGGGGRIKTQRQSGPFVVIWERK